MLRNKKADAPTVILVLMVLVLAIAGLFIFLQNQGKLENSIVNARVIDSVYLKEQEIEFYLKTAAEKVLDEQQGFTEQGFKTNLINEISGQQFEDELLNSFKNKINNIQVNVQGDKIIIELKDFEIYSAFIPDDTIILSDEPITGENRFLTIKYKKDLKVEVVQ